MQDQDKTKEQLIDELREMRQKVSAMEATEVRLLGTEKALRESEERFRLLYENTPLAYQSLDENGCFLEVNQAWLDMLGYSRDEVIGKWSGDFLTPPYREKFITYFQQYLEAGEVHGIEYEIIKKDGSTILGTTDGKVGRDKQGRFKQTHCILYDISERKRTETALRETEQQYRLLADNALDVIWQTDLDMRFTYVNPAIVLMMGYTPDEFIGTRIEEHCDKENFMKIAQIALEEISKGADSPGATFETVLLRKNKDPVSIEVHGKVVLGKNGLPAGFQGVSRDITVRKRSEEALLRSEERLRLAQGAANVGVWDWNLADQTLDWTPELEALYGLEPGTVLKYENWTEMVHPEDLYRIESERDNAIAQRRTFEMEFRIRHRSGETRWLYARGGALYDEEGNPSRVFGINMDITERVTAELQRSLLTLAIEQAAEAVVVTDAEGTIRYVNPAFEAITGYTSDEAVGQTPRLLKSGEHDAKFYGQMWDTIKEGNVWSGRFVNRRKDERLYQEEATISPVRDSSGNIVNFVAVKRDITEHLDLSKQLLQAQKMEAVGTLAGGVAHDFNNILQVALGYSDLILGDEGLPQRYRGDLRKINESAKRGAELVKRLLTFSRKTEVNPLPLNLNRRINEVREMLDRTVPKMIQIQVVLAEDLAAINADATQLDQVLMNLAVNARDAMPDGGRIVIETANVILDEEYATSHLGAHPGQYVLLTLADTGAGIDKEVLEHIFEPFYTTKEAGVGTGLGLAMVYGIVQQHGGRIRCYSEPGQGTTFKIYFPAIVSDEEPEEKTTKVMPPGGSETILLVDDEDMIRDLSSRILTKAGYDVITASNGKEAVDLYRAQSERISLIILDLIMPEMGGKRCLEELLDIDPSVKVVIASGHSARGQAEQALLAGVKGFVNKPYDIRQVLEVVRTVLDGE